MSTGWQWYYAQGSSPDTYRGGFPTLAEAVSGACGDYGGQIVTIVEALKEAPSPPGGEDVVDLFGDQNEDAWGEDGFEGLTGSPEAVEVALAELTAAVKGWFDKHSALLPTAWMFAQTRNETTFNTSTLPEAVETSPALVLMAEERLRQIVVEGWSEGHDDEHSNGELLRAAILYRWHGVGVEVSLNANGVPHAWPWDPEWWKPGDARKNLIRAGGLMLAERERRGRSAEDCSTVDQELSACLADLNALVVATAVENGGG